MRFLRKLVLILTIGSVALALAICGVAWWIFFRPMPQTSGSVKTPGLKAAVTVRRDSLGVPHIQAASLPDLYFAQGYVTAQDRLFQMDALRRLAGGTLAEIVGEDGYRTDADRWMMGMDRTAAAAVQTLPADQRAYLESYAAGVNAFIDANRGRLPMEFRVLRYSPAPWTPRDSLLIGLHMFQVLTATTWRDELYKLLLLSKTGPELTAQLLPTRTDQDHPPADELSPAHAIVARSSGNQRPSRNAAVAVRRREGRPALFARPDLNGGQSPHEHAIEALLEQAGQQMPEPPAGSNNWVFSGAHTASGRAMLANDPHLQLSLPSIWYTIQLEAPESNAAGVSLPGMPAVIIGHNDRVAWGETNVGPDIEDVYIETTDPKRPDFYEADGEWLPVQKRHVKIAIRGQQPREITVRSTRHGPVVMIDAGVTYSMRWVGFDPIAWSLPFFAVNAAHNWTEFRAALARYPGPGQNFVYADVDGNIGYQATGFIPIRPHGDGSMPLPGNVRANDWKGYIPFEQLPSVYNPPTGMIATANCRISPDNYPYVITTKWETPDRTDRIYQLLQQHRKFTPDDFSAIQTDVYSRHFRLLGDAIAAALEHTRAGNPEAQRIATDIRRWDGNVRRTETAPSVIQFVRTELLTALLRPKIGPPYIFYRWFMANVFLERILRDRPAEWLPPGTKNYDELLARCVDTALTPLREGYRTPDPSKWVWGPLELTSIAHPFAGRLPSWFRGPFMIGPFEQNGNQWTVKQTTPQVGPSMRFIIDFAALDGASVTLPVGESGQVFNKHFKDQFQAWYDGRRLPLPFTDAAVAHATTETLLLQPSEK